MHVGAPYQCCIAAAYSGATTIDLEIGLHTPTDDDNNKKGTRVKGCDGIDALWGGFFLVRVRHREGAGAERGEVQAWVWAGVWSST